jgi:hypothetical protein
MNPGFVVTALMLAQTAALTADLKPHTLEAFERYILKTEARLDQRVRGGDFLWVDDSPATMKEVRAGGVAIRPLAGKGELGVKDGLIHDWIGAVFIPGTTVDKVLATVQDYNRHKNTHKPEVIDSKLLARNGNEFKVFLRVWKHKVITVVMNTEHQVKYFPVDKARWHSRSYSTRIAQVENAGKKDEHELKPGHGGGYLWRLYSYWRFEERDGGVYVECQAISLTRDVPALVSFFVTPIIRSLPRESLENTLKSTRNAVKG